MRTTEFHNLFGEHKPRIKIRKKGKKGSRSHFWKETPIDNLVQLNKISEEKRDLELFLDLEQTNQIYCLNKLLYINRLYYRSLPKGIEKDFVFRFVERIRKLPQRSSKPKLLAIEWRKILNKLVRYLKRKIK